MRDEQIQSEESGRLQIEKMLCDYMFDVHSQQKPTEIIEINFNVIRNLTFLLFRFILFRGRIDS